MLVRTTAGSVDLGVTIGSDPYVPSREKFCDSTVNECGYTVDPDGTVVVTRRAGNSAFFREDVTIFRPDHTVVQLFLADGSSAGGHASDGSNPVLTLDQLVTIGRNRAFTLYP